MHYAAIGILVLIIVWALYEWYEHNRVLFTENEINTNDWNHKQELVLIVISDLHNNKKYFEKKLLDCLKQQIPDVFLLCGDIVNKHKSNNDNAIHFLEKLSEIAPVLYSYGNHESELKRNHPDQWMKYLNRLPKNCVLLDNESVQLSMLLPLWKGITVTGLTLPEPFYQRGKLIEDKHLLPKLKRMNSTSYQILLAHNPEYFPFYQEQYKPDLIVSGHLHGGIIRLPIIGGLLSPRFRIPEYDSGIRKIETTTMLISKGLGSHTLWIRLFNRVEVNKIIIKSEGNNGTID